MKRRHWITLGITSLAALGAGLALKSFLPPHFPNFPTSSLHRDQRRSRCSLFCTQRRYRVYCFAVRVQSGSVYCSAVRSRRGSTSWDEASTSAQFDARDFPAIEVIFLRCGSVHIPEPIAVRGSFSLAPRTIAHSAVLIRHPHATFLYDTGLCTDISSYLAHRSLFFRKTLANFTFEQSLRHQLQQHGLAHTDLDFALLSHLHWDHVSGVPDLPGLPLRVQRVEYDAAHYGPFEQEHGLVPDLLGNNPIELFDCTGPAYAGFRSSYDLFGDGSIVLVPLPGHTAGNTGMFINRSNGSRVFLLGDAAWVAANYQRPTTMHPFIWSRVTSDDATARQTLLQLHSFALQHPDIALIAMHDAALQEAFSQAEAASLAAIHSENS